MAQRDVVFPPGRQALYEKNRYSPAIRSNDDRMQLDGLQVGVVPHGIHTSPRHGRTSRRHLHRDARPRAILLLLEELLVHRLLRGARVTRRLRRRRL